MARAALLIGVSQHGSGLKSLPAASGDVRAMQRVLQAREWGDFEVEYPLIDPESTDMQVIVEKFFVSRAPDDLALLYFSGYALLDDRGRLYLSTRSTNKSLFRATSMPVSFLQDALSASPCRHHVLIFDCCFCDESRKLIMKRDRAITVSQQLGHEGRVILLSSDTAAYSFEHKQGDCSTYTRYLVEGIETGAASADATRSSPWLTVQDVHRYASRKTQIAAPLIEPNMIASDEADTMQPIAKIQAPAAILNYRQAAERYAYLGQFSPVDRAILETCRLQLEVSPEAAAEIEAQILRPYQDRFKALQTYREFIPILQERYPLDQLGDRLKELQIFLGLGDDDVASTNHDILAHANARQQALKSRQRLENLQRYRSAVVAAAQTSCPLSQADQEKLKDLQTALSLSDDDGNLIQAEITSRIMAEAAERDHKLKQYGAEFSRLIRLGLPLNALAKQELAKFRQSLGLTDVEVASLEQRLLQIAETGAAHYPDHLKRYEQELLQAVVREYPLNDLTQARLNAFQKALGLKPDDAQAIRQRVFAEADAQLEQHQQHLTRYQIELAQAIAHELPLTAATEERLTDLQRSLGLSDVEVGPMRQELINTAKAKEAEHQEHLNRYDKEFVRTLNREYPLSEGTRRRLTEFQTFLGLTSSEVQPIEAAAIATFQRERDVSRVAASPLTPPASLDHHPQPLPTASASTQSASTQSASTQLTPDQMAAPTSLSDADSDADSTVMQSFPDLSSSAFSVLFAELQNLLEKGLWKEADEKTFSLLLRLAGGDDAWLSKAAVESLSCGDLQSLDQLWVTYSNGQFGFSVQYQMYSSLPKKEAIAFAKRVGWWQSGLEFFKLYRLLSFSTAAPRGHLPAKWFWKISPDESRQAWGLGLGRGGTATDTWLLSTFMQTLERCHLPSLNQDDPDA